MLAEGENGELEHLPQQEIERALGLLVYEAWLEKETLRPSDRKARINDFLATYRQPLEEWDILWEIGHLKVDEPLTIANVEFLPFAGETARSWRTSEGHPWHKVEEELIGRTFARARVRAGSSAKALLRGKDAIDDALNVLRVILEHARFIPDEQCLQVRGLHYFARSVLNPNIGKVGGERGFDPVELGIGGELLVGIRARISELGIAFDRKRSENLRLPIVRSLLWIGSSIARGDLDDRVVDLCTALECLLSLESDKRKAQAIAVRYMLAGYAVGDNSYVTHPLEIYDLYLLRNKIVHGSARRICAKEDYDALMYVALDAVDRITKHIIDQPNIYRLSRLFDHMATEESLEKIVTFMDRHGTTLEAVKEVGELARDWLNAKQAAGAREY